MDGPPLFGQCPKEHVSLGDVFPFEGANNQHTHMKYIRATLSRIQIGLFRVIHVLLLEDQIG